MKSSKILIVVVAVMGLFLMGQGSANAVPILQLSDGVTTFTITDGGLGDANGAAGAITFVGAVGRWTINVSTGLTKPAIGSAALAHMDLNSINTYAGNGHPLTILFSDTDFTGPLSGIFQVGGTMSAPAGSTALFSSYFDNGNANLAQTVLISTLGPFGPGAFSQTNSFGALGEVPPYSITLGAQLNFTGAGLASFDEEFQGKVPEPISLILLGSGLVGAGLYRRLRRKS